MKKTVLTLFLIASITAFSQGAGTDGAITLTTGFSMDLDISSVTNKTRLTLVGPANRWMAVGFGGTNMSSGADVFRTDGSPSNPADDGDYIDARSTGNFLPNADGSQDWTLISDNVNGGVRTIIVERDNDSSDASDFDFNPSADSISIMWALGSSSGYAYHSENRGAAVINTLSTKEIKNLDFEVFPNPTTDVVNVQLPTGTNSATAKVFDTSGRLIATQEISNPREQINISTLASGIYVLRISSEGRFGARRIIKN